MFWFILMILTIISTVSTSRATFFYMLFIYTCMFLLVTIQYKFNIDVYVEKNISFHGVLLIFLILVNLVNFVINYIYVLISKLNKEQYLEIKNKNRHITLLYQQLKKREQILEEKNEILSQYSFQLEKNKQKLEDMAYKDSLTGLPNRRMIMEQLEQLIAENKSSDKFALVTIDIDDFRKVNDSMGHTFGDYILLQAIDRIKSIRKKEDILARSGGDDLVLLVKSCKTRETLETYVRNICDLFDLSFQLASVQMKITVSVGISLWPKDGASAENILKSSETAMHKSKSSGKTPIIFITRICKTKLLRKYRWNNILYKRLKMKIFIWSINHFLMQRQKKFVPMRH